MARFRVYFKPFNPNGTYQTDWTEVTADVAVLGDIKSGIEDTSFDVGAVRNKGVNLVMRNDHGRYSQVDSPSTIFFFKRKNTQVKVTWDIRSYDLIAGFFACGEEPLGGETVIFKGVLNEITSQSELAKQQISFMAMSFDSLLDEIEVPFGSISAGDLFSDILLACLDQAPFNELVTVSAANIDPSIDLATDDIADLENKPVGKILQSLLLGANSVLYINDDTVYVTPRTASADVEHTFHGQATDSGIEDIINIANYRDGLSRVFNLWRWGSTGISARDSDSIDTYGVKDKEMSLDLIDEGSTSKVQAILDANRDEFANPKKEFDLETPIWYIALGLLILDKVAIDYPTVYITYDGSAIPRYGQVTYDGVARYPYEQQALTIGTETGYKILNRKINIQKQTMTFGLREA